jgi:protein-S-isoprenylcysteine O-methyltransferase Ste14
MEFINKVFNHPGLRKALVKSRVFLGIGFLLVILVYGRQEHYFLAFAVSVLGEVIQVWSSGSLEKNKVLTARGPYSLIRNPMYLGRFLVILGGIFLLGNIYFVFVYGALYYFYMVNRVSREEKHLEKIFGDPYREYCLKVNRFIPNFRVYDKGELVFFRFNILFHNNEHLNFLAVIGFYIIFYVCNPMINSFLKL